MLLLPSSHPGAPLKWHSEIQHCDTVLHLPSDTGLAVSPRLLLPLPLICTVLLTAPTPYHLLLILLSLITKAYANWKYLAQFMAGM